MAEQLLEYNTGGAIATAAFSPCGTPTGADLLTREILKKIYVEHERILGRILYDARCRIISQFPTIDSLYGPAVIYGTFGDPALRVKYPVIPGVAEEVAKPSRKDFDFIGPVFVMPYPAEVTAYDSQGRLRFSRLAARSGETLFLPAGVYFLRLRRGEEESFGKIVIVK
jgi:hypothetical protein